MKKFRAVLMIIIAVFSSIFVIDTKTDSPVIAQSHKNNYEELSITLLHPYIDKAITDFYGFSRRYEIGDSKLEISERDGNIFTVKVTADTFEGPHNNYFTEIITFTVTPSDVTLESYIHSDFIR